MVDFSHGKKYNVPCSRSPAEFKRSIDYLHSLLNLAGIKHRKIEKSNKKEEISRWLTNQSLIANF